MRKGLLSTGVPRSQHLLWLGMALGLGVIVLLTVGLSQQWQQTLVDHARQRQEQSASWLIHRLSVNLTDMLQIHARNLQFLQALQSGDVPQATLNTFLQTHQNLQTIPCTSAQIATKSYTLAFTDSSQEATGLRSSFRIGVPQFTPQGHLQVPLRVINRNAREDPAGLCVLVGLEQSSTMGWGGGRQTVILLDSRHRLLALWQNGRWEAARAPAKGLIQDTGLTAPVTGTPWVLHAERLPLLDAALQSSLVRVRGVTLFLLVAELGFGIVFFLWIYRRRMEGIYGHAQLALRQQLLDQGDTKLLYNELLTMAVRTMGAKAAFIAVPMPDIGRLKVSFAVSDQTAIVAALGEMPLSLDLTEAPWGQLAPCLAYHQRQRVDGRSPQASGARRRAEMQLPGLRGRAESIAWPLLGTEGDAPEAVIVLEFSRLRRIWFGAALLAAWDAMVQDLAHDSRQRRARREREHLLLHDSLTGLPNRRSFLHTAEERLQRAETQGLCVDLAVLDLDAFNEVNSIYGAVMADRCLLSLTGHFQAILAEEQVLVARIGGDEFAFLVSRSPESPPRHDWWSTLILGAVERVGRELLAASLNASLGWASFPEDAQEALQLLNQADEAMSDAKSDAGRSSWRVWSGPVAQRARQRLWVHQNFANALADRQIVFFLQAKADLLTQKITGFEMLARWRNPLGGWIMPGKFMPYVEENAQLIRLLGIFALQEAVRLRQRLQAEGRNWQVALNIGARHFLGAYFLEDLAEHCPDGRGITLEITETSSILGRKPATPIMEACRWRGFSLSMDDFGTGYSSLLSVARLRFDELKLDQGFIRQFHTDLASFGVAGAAQLLSQIVHCRLVAEGISTPQAMRLWLRLGGRYIQGYLLAPPLPESAFFTWCPYLLPPLPSDAMPTPLHELDQLWATLQS